MKTLKIYGPPGTGKTHRLLGLFEEELKTTPPERIGFVTFTRQARLEALRRTGKTEDELPYVKTLHAICYKLLGLRHENLVQRDNLVKFGRAIGAPLTGYMPDVLSLESMTEAIRQPTKADRLLQLNHLGRHRGMSLREALRDAPTDLDFAYSKWFTESYRAWKTEEGLLDYTDILTQYLDAGPALSADVLFVDEAQDLSWLQWKVVHKLGGSVRRRYLAGDDDQAIFIWAGASADMFNTEPADEIEILPQSYRIARAIHDTAHKIINRVRVRQAKEFRPREEPGLYQQVGYLDPQWLEHGSTYALFRNYHRGIAMASALEELGIPFHSTQHGVLGTPAVAKSLSGWLKVAKGDHVEADEARAMVDMSVDGNLQGGARERVRNLRGAIPPTAIFNQDALHKSWSALLPRLPKMGYIERVTARYGWNAVIKPNVRLLSIHQSKGGEADTVVLDMELARRTYDAYMTNPDDEHRVFYVAVTRARDRLFTLMPTGPMCYQI